MLVGDLIRDLQRFSELDAVFIQSGDGEIWRLDSTHAVWVKGDGPYMEVDQDAEDHGILLYG